MFKTDGFVITLSRGDTGAIKIIADTDYTFTSDDRVLFSVKNAIGEVVKESVSALDENKAFTVTFYNQDTDSLAAGSYSWDVRYLIHPYYDAAGRIVNSDQVLTPILPQELQLLQVVGDV